ncbi:MAG TPA: ATP-dependent helicase HrpB [Bryobacteraceae bacterium]|nr:ATP-dependent helicase HrpB [Bryobacteraceae bacterium]
MRHQIAKLPVDDLLPAIRESLGRSHNLVIEAPPGAGKTTRVPPALLDLVSEQRQVLVLEPRRLAARLAARRVAQELGEKLGETIGYQVRFEEVAGPRTRLRFLTEGILTRRLISDPLLADVDTVVLDEFHERHLETDLALALLRRLQRTKRPDLRIVVMSATLDAAPIAAFLDGCPILRSEGRLFDLSLVHQPYSALPIEKQVASALEALVAQSLTGDVLVFLPGVAEIRRTERECRPLAARNNLLLLPLYGDLSPAEQDRAVSPAPQRKVILSTNVAESSITVEGVTTVIDSGLARIASDSPWTGLPTLEVARISKASATQRAGRAARTAPGRVIRLYTADDLHRRRDQDPPEILRRELSELCLTLRAMGLSSPLDLDWLDLPPPAALARAEDLLERLGVDADRARRMARFPLHPRLARLVIDAVERGVGEEGCRAAAALSSGARSPSCDLMSLIDSPLDPVTQRHFEQIRRIVRPAKDHAHHPHALALSILTAFPDRLARRRKDDQLLLASGGSAVLGCEARVDFLVAVDIEDRSEKVAPLVRLYCAIEPAGLPYLLVDLFPDRVQERAGVEWNRTAERVDAVSALLYENLVIEETRSGAPDPEQAAAMLAERALDEGIERFVDPAQLDQFLARVDFASEHASIAKFEIKDAFRELCLGLKSFAELKAAGPSLISTLEQRAGSRMLNEIAPSRIRLPNGRQTNVNYEAGKPPWIASRLQDFFGMRETPRIANGKVSLVVHLLAPNKRPVQTTTDLTGFWQRLYPRLRRELGRRYPKHAWPEDPY